MLYGEPRITHDIDLLVFLRPTDIARLPTVFPPPEFYVPPPEVIGAELSRDRGSFNIIHADSGLKCDLYGVGRDEMDGWAFRNIRKYAIKGLTITLAPPRICHRSKTRILPRRRLRKTHSRHPLHACCIWRPNR